MNHSMQFQNLAESLLGSGLALFRFLSLSLDGLRFDEWGSRRFLRHRSRGPSLQIDAQRRTRIARLIFRIGRFRRPVHRHWQQRCTRIYEHWTKGIDDYMHTMTLFSKLIFWHFSRHGNFQGIFPHLWVSSFWRWVVCWWFDLRVSFSHPLEVFPRLHSLFRLSFLEPA